MNTFSRIGGLPVRIDRIQLSGLEQRVQGDFVRRTTVVHLHGRGRTGRGEDVGYDAGEQLALLGRGAAPDLAGDYTLSSFSERLGATNLFPRPPNQEASRSYRRWAFESAALDLALQQADASLAGCLGMKPRPVRFVVSASLGRPPSTAALTRLLALRPRSEFKLDAGPSWDEALIADIRRVATVCVVDFKGAYHGTPVDQPADPELYARVARAFPDVWLEDPGLTPETLRVLAPHRGRITWDAPIHSVEDIRALADTPRALNIKPSRFGTLRALFDAYDHCRAHEILMYGGGQFELGPGRDQVQYLASLFHPSECNDVAPRAYNAREPAAEALLESPLRLEPQRAGFRLVV